MFRIYKVDLITESTYVETIGFEDSGLEKMLRELNLNNKSSALVCSGFEVFCYRPKPDKPYHPKMHPTYIRARERASRILNGIFVIIIESDEVAFVSFAQVNDKVYTKFFKKLSKQNSYYHDHEVENFAKAVDSWMGEFYTDEIGSKQYRTKNRYPLAPTPIKGYQLHVITLDDDGNLIAYQTEV